MALIQTDFSNAVRGSTWKLVYTERQDPSYTSNNSVFYVGRVLEDTRVRFGRSREHDTEYSFTKTEFCNRLIHVPDLERKYLETQTEALLAVFKGVGSEDHLTELKELIVRIEV